MGPFFLMLSDVGRAFRQLVKTPGYTVVAILTLALGIGVNTAMFSVLNATLLKPPAYPQPDRLVRLYRTSPQSQAWPHAPANFLDYREKFTTIESLTAFTWRNFNLAITDQPAERLRGLVASGDFFQLLGRPPLLGRTFGPADDAPGQNAVVVLSHETWQTRFGADPAIVGRPLHLDGETVTVIGVMPAGFNDPLLWGRIDAWRPLALTDEERGNRSTNYLNLIARLAPGATVERARAETAAIAAQTARDFPDTNAENGMIAASFAGSRMDAAGRRMSWLNLGLAGFVLAIACANLANLQLARAAAQRRQHAIMAALGASRRRLFMQALTECLLLAAAGGALGLLLAGWASQLIGQHIVVAEQAGWAVELDGSVLLFSAVASLTAGILFGVLPSLTTARADVNDALKQGGRGTTGTRAQQRVRQGLIIAQFALALVLLAGGALFLRGLHAFMTRDPGWKIDDLLTARVSLPAAAFATEENQVHYFNQLEENLRAVPGVASVGLASSLPIWSFSTGQSFAIEGRPPPVQGREPITFMTTVSPGFFATAGVRLLRGRGFTAADTASAPRVVVINEVVAETFFPGEDPVGQRLGGEDPADPEWTVIVGVVNSVEPLANLGGPFTRYQMYTPLAQSAGRDMMIVLRTAVPPETIGRTVREAAARVDHTVPMYDLAPARTLAGRILTNFTVGGWLLAGFALLGLMLAALGLYGVIAGNVVRRTPEIGVRLALGAQGRDVGRMIVGGGARLAAWGTLIGLVGAFALTRALAHAVPALPTQDPAPVAVVTAILIAVALLASWIPARRAMRIDPIDALRSE